jgi:hypothetical protein
VADPRDKELERSPRARRLAERALVALLNALDGEGPEIIVLGGLVPEILVSGQDPPAPGHLGTTDVDILLVSHLTITENLEEVERALEAIGFSSSGEGKGWRWRGLVDGHAVKMEFLCDLDDRKEEELVEVAGCDTLVALNLRGTRYVARDWAWETLRAPLPDGQMVEVQARFARLGGYLLSKLTAARTRAAVKDFYDLAYVLLHNQAGGPQMAAAAVYEGGLGSSIASLRSTLVEVGERYRSPSSVGPQGYAEQSLIMDPQLDERTLRLDAVTAVREFLQALFARQEDGAY